MHVFFEDDGQLKAGTVLTDNDSSLQVEAASGKRLKIKAAAVLLRYAEPSPTLLVAQAQTQSRELDPNFLWEVSGDDDFGFADLAREYYGHAPGPVEAAAVAMTLAAAPMYFYKRGQGSVSQGAGRSARRCARVGRAQEARGRADDRVGRRSSARAGCPRRCATKLSMLLYKPDKNSLEWKALAAASDATAE